jgi:phosphohistidine phosphatase
MKKLILLRHAKAINAGNYNDIERCLVKEGRSDIKTNGIFYKGLGINPDLVICSTAVRTKETLDIFLEFSGIHSRIVYEEIIYENEVKKIINYISGINDIVSNLMIIGHNPTLENLVPFFTNRVIPGDFKTSGIAIINFDIKSWKEISVKKGVLELYKNP